MAAKQKSLLLLEKSGAFSVQETDIPEPGPGELLVEIRATALNPVDWKLHVHGYFIEQYPAVLGTDSAGVVEKVGEGVRTFVPGDKVLHQGYFDKRRATFQQYAIVPAEIAAKIPPNLTFDQASTIPLTLGTAAVGLYNRKILPYGGAGLVAPWAGGRGEYYGQPILVIGGSSSVGQHVIQLAKLSAFSPIIVTASKRNEDYLKSLGATHVLDRSSVPPSTLCKAVRAITAEPITIIFDTVSEAVTQEACYDILAPGGRLILVAPFVVDESKRTVEKEVIEVLANVHVPTQRELGVALYQSLTALLESGDIKPNNVEVIPGGLSGIPDGLVRLREGVSACKLVVRPQDAL